MRVLFRDGADELVAGEVIYATATRDLEWLLFDREEEGDVEGLYLELSSSDDNGNSDCCVRVCDMLTAEDIVRKLYSAGSVDLSGLTCLVNPSEREMREVTNGVGRRISGFDNAIR